MPSKDDIRAHLDRSLVALFDVPAGDIRPTARLYEDLDIDSLDAVDLVIELRDLTGVRVAPEQFRRVRTVSDVVETVYALTLETGQPTALSRVD